MKNEAEEKVREFYEGIGWDYLNDNTEDSKRWEDLRECAREYVSKCRLRVLRHIPAKGENILDMASGPVQYPEYLIYSKNFNKRYCVDLSAKALEVAKLKLGDHGVYLHGSFFDIPLEENFFDCSISLHTIYHIDKDLQEEAVRKLLLVTKPGQPLIIVYANPDMLSNRYRRTLIARIFRKLRKIVFPAKKKLGNKIEDGFVTNDLYYHAHPLTWWKRFEDVAGVQIKPWRSMRSDTQQKYIPDNALGKLILKVLFWKEDIFPAFFVRNFHYPMIILRKR
jgi:ubiquinone/menaquinone biosynthesis C-methylase UbiE